MKGIVYKIWSDSTNDIYVGSTIQSAYDRMKNHKKKSNQTLSREIIKYGNAKIEIIEEIEFDDIIILRNKEKEYILLYKDICCNYIGKLTDEEKKERSKKYQMKYSKTPSGIENAKKRRDKFYQANKEKMRAYHLAKYYENVEENKKKQNERRRIKVNCPHCNLEYSKSYLNQHIKRTHI